MAKLSELRGVEQPVTEWLVALGWTHRSADDLKPHNRKWANPIIEAILTAKVAELNKVTPAVARTAVEQLTQHLRNPVPVLGNEKFLELLATGVTLALPTGDRTLRFIDYDDPQANDLTVTTQYWVQGQEMVKTDIVLLINGIPLVPIEAKQRARQGSNWMQGVKQFSTYEQRAERYWMTHAFGVTCNGRLTKYGIPGASASYFNEWKTTTLDPQAGNPLQAPANKLVRLYNDPTDGGWNFDVERLPNGQVLEQMKVGIVGLLQPARVLDIVRHFLVFERTEGRIIKKVARYQQLRAANKITERVAATDLRQGVIWHTQGSGKSLTMLYTALKLRQDVRLNDPTVYIVVDRKDLREQIGGTFDDCEFPNARAVLSIGDLKSIIQTAPAGVFITTIQKFRELGNIQDARPNVILLIDEAHRSQYGDFQIELQNVLPNARRFAFTGTPIPKTHREFGLQAPRDGEQEHYLDRYSIKDAIDDGATVPIRYTFGPQEWFLDKDKLREGYQELTAELTDEEKRAVEVRVQPWKTFLKHPDRVARLAQDVAEDYRAVVEPQGFKAQVVVCDKEACVRYFDALLTYFDRSEIAIVFSEGSYETAEKYELFKDHYKDDKARRDLIKQFKRPLNADEIQKGNTVRILIVCNMLLTGFDAPVEQTMYLDSPLRDHTLLQAVARTNRPYDNKATRLSKSFGRIVDYVGVFENYKEALNYDPADLEDFATDVDSLAKQFPDVLEKAFVPFAHITLADTYACSMEIVRTLSALDHGKFEDSYREVVQLWEALSPHPSLRASRERYQWLTEIFEIYLEEFRRLDFDAEVYAVKTRQLIQENARLINFKGHLPEIAIDADYLDALRETKLSPSDKAEKIIRDIETVIRRNELSSAVYVEFQQRLDDLILRKQAAAAAIEQILLELGGLYQELDEVASLPERMGFPERGTFELFTLLKNATAPDAFDEERARAFAVGVVEELKREMYIGWQEIGAERTRMRTRIKLFAADDAFWSLAVFDDEELLDRLLDAVVRYYALT